MTIPFVFFSDRLSRIEIYHDVLKDFEFHNHITSFELHVFGIVNQYQRIQKVLKRMMSINDKSISRNNDSSQFKLDIYYFILTWDKLKKIFTKIKSQTNKIIREGRTTKDFVTDYKPIRKCIEKLFDEYDDSVRNEYEHPSLEYQRIGRSISYGNIIIDNSGITVHVGGNVNVTIKIKHVEQIESLRIDLIDLFIKHFTDKTSTRDLLKLRKNFIDDIRKNSKDYKKIIKGKNSKLSSEMFHNLMMTDTFFSTEGIPIPQSVRNKIHNTLF
jgi:hypothetical protein